MTPKLYPANILIFAISWYARILSDNFLPFIVEIVVAVCDDTIEKVSVGAVGSTGWICSRQVTGTSAFLRFLIEPKSVGTVHST